MLMTEDEEVAYAKLVNEYLPPAAREFAARNLLTLSRYLYKDHGEIAIVTEGIDSKIQVSYDGLHWTIKEITS